MHNSKHKISMFGRPMPQTGQPGKSWYSLKAVKAEDASELYIYDEIGWFGVTAEDFVRDLAGVTAKTINLHLNTPGGSVFEGVAIYNALKSHSARVVTHIDGLAASMGSIIALAGDEIRMAASGFFMIHNPWSIAIGSAADFRKEADILDKIAGTMADIYAGRTGKDLSDIRTLMDDETWFTGEEAKAAGFVDAVFNGNDDEAAKASAKFDLSVFAKVPAPLAAPSAAAERIQTIREFEAALREGLGFSHAQAKAIASQGFKPASEPPAEDVRACLEIISRNLKAFE